MGYFFHTSSAGLGHLDTSFQEEGYRLIRRSKFPVVRKRPGATDADISRAYAAETSYPPIAKASPIAGHFNITPDEDGTVRWVPLVLKYRDHYFPPLTIQMLRQYLKAARAPSTLLLDLDASGVLQVTLGPMEIPTDERGWMLINYLGPRNTLPYVSATDVFHRRLPEGFLKDRLVILGATAAGIYDLRVTPFDSNMPGPEIHGMILENILSGSFVIRPKWVVVVDFAAVILFGLLISVVSAWSRALWSGLLGLAVVCATLGFDYHLFMNEGIWINVTTPLLTVAVAFVGITITKYLTEEKEKRFYRSAFGQYLSPKVIERIVENPDLLSLGGERKVLTACFTDLERFTVISEKMNPEQLVEFLNQYLTAMTEIILGHDGTVDKFEGDAIIAFYGAPLPLDDHPRRACLAAVKMQDQLAELRPRWAEQGLPELKMRVGVHTGPMVVGNMGSQKKMDYTIIGDSVNLTARLEGVNKFYRTSILVSEATWQAAGDGLIGREVDIVRVVGRAEPIRIFELVSLGAMTEEDWEEHATRYAEGLKAYRAQRWDEAERAFGAALATKPEDGPSAVMIERCKAFRQSPPDAGWDGVFALGEK
jgi:adenylate cyclase